MLRLLLALRKQFKEGESLFQPNFNCLTHRPSRLDQRIQLNGQILRVKYTV